MTIRWHLFLFSFLLSAGLFAQDFAGQWQGELTQDGKPGRFIYQIDLVQHDNRVSGTATSQSEAGEGPVGKFELGGQWDGKTLTLQEVKQLTPEGARWCLKHIRLKYVDGELKGSWEAEGCTPGWIVLRRKDGIGSQEGAYPKLKTENSKLPGRWTGSLSQSDRDYGFFFEVNLNADGTGTSKIISDGEGGNATHALRWSFDEDSGFLKIEESKVLEKSVATWPWCIKSANLYFQEETNRLSLAGRWEGFIEGHSSSTGACAPGKLYLERPIFQEEKTKVKANEPAPVTTPEGVKEYEEKEEREVSVDRVLEVRNKTVKIAVWDSGTVDGDVLSLFVNGDLILENYRVARRKHVSIVKLEKSTNYLILHAINLGDITPNTVAISVDDGYEEQVVIMSSNLRESGAVMLREFTVGE